MNEVSTILIMGWVENNSESDEQLLFNRKF